MKHREYIFNVRARFWSPMTIFLRSFIDILVSKVLAPPVIVPWSLSLVCGEEARRVERPPVKCNKDCIILQSLCSMFFSIMRIRQRLRQRIRYCIIQVQRHRKISKIFLCRFRGMFCVCFLLNHSESSDCPVPGNCSRLVFNNHFAKCFIQDILSPTILPIIWHPIENALQRKFEMITTI